jgi:hypothetical protein
MVAEHPTLDAPPHFRHNAPQRAWPRGCNMCAMNKEWGGMQAILAARGAALADGLTLQEIGSIAQAFAGILAGLIAVLGVPLALRQVLNLQREIGRYQFDVKRHRDAEANLNISAHYSLSHAAHVPAHVDDGAQFSPPNARTRQAQVRGTISAQPTPAPEPGKRVLRLDLTLENVGEGTVDVLGCLVAARELERQGDEVIAGGRDAQWEDLTPHYWDAGDDTLSPGISTTKHTVYAQDALARVKARSRKTLARIDQIREQVDGADIYLLYRVFVVARRATRSSDDLREWMALQRALLNVNAPAFRAAAGEHDPLGYAASPDGWRLFLHHYEALADAKLSQLRSAADREELALADPVERGRAQERHAAELRAYCERTLLPGWKRFCEDHDRMLRHTDGFAGLLGQKGFRTRERAVERQFPWSEQEVWTEYFYVTLETLD